MARFISALDGNNFVNLDYIAVIQILPRTGGADDGTWQIRCRTGIAWGTAGYGHQDGHLLVLADKLPNKSAAQEWVVNLMKVSA